jgi:anti-anti-sigma regulatory factor
LVRDPPLQRLERSPARITSATAARRAVELSSLDADITVVKLLGEHDLSSNDELLERLQEPALAGRLLVVDLSETEFIDCSVLSSLIEVDRLARDEP